MLISSIGGEPFLYNDIIPLSHELSSRLLIEQVKDFSAKLPKFKEKVQAFGLMIHGGDNYIQRIEAQP